MSILAIGDGHFKATRLDLVARYLQWLNETIDQVQPTLIVYLGDMFHNHAIIRSEILSMFNEHIQQNHRYNKYYIVGNHDMYTPHDNKYHALQSMKDAYDHFTVIDKVVDIHGITFVPFTADLSQFPMQTQPVVMAHQTFIGADYGYTKADAGVDADKISADIIISGHVHKRQAFGKVIYPGSAYAQSVNDIDQPKGVMLFDMATYKTSFIECPLPAWRSAKYEIDRTYSIDNMHEDLVNTLDDINNWVVDITGHKAEIVAYLDSKMFNELRSGKSVRIRANYIEQQKESTKITANTASDIIAEYVNNIYTGTLDKQQIIRKAQEIKSKIGQ